MIKYINLISCFLTISLSFGSTLDGSDGRDKVVSILDNQNELKIISYPISMIEKNWMVDALWDSDWMKMGLQEISKS